MEIAVKMEDYEKEITESIKSSLEEFGYDGLCHRECCCFLDNFSPCDLTPDQCEPGYKVKNDSGEFVIITDEGIEHFKFKLEKQNGYYTIS
jgi:hypothetical protein